MLVDLEKVGKHCVKVLTLLSIFDRNKRERGPGPASSVVERSLRNIPSEGTAVRSPLRRHLFKREFIRNLSANDNSEFRRVLPISQPRYRKGCSGISTV